MRNYTNVRILGIDMTLQQKFRLCMQWVLVYLCVGLVTGIITARIAVFVLSLK